LNDELIAKAEQLDHELDAKNFITKAYLYSQASSCRTPAIDISYVTPDEITRAVNESVKEAGLDPLKIQFPMDALQAVALEKGELVCP